MAPITPEGKAWLRDRETEFLDTLEAIREENAAQLAEERKALRVQSDRLDHRYRIVTYGLIVMAFMLIVGVVVGGVISSAQSRRISDRATDAQRQSDRLAELQGFTRRTAIVNQDALCALRHDLEQRVAASDAFLREHPDGFAGIPAAQIRVSTAGQRRTIQALSGIRCR